MGRHIFFHLEYFLIYDNGFRRQPCATSSWVSPISDYWDILIWLIVIQIFIWLWVIWIPRFNIFINRLLLLLSVTRNYLNWWLKEELIWKGLLFSQYMAKFISISFIITRKYLFSYQIHFVIIFIFHVHCLKLSTSVWQVTERSYDVLSCLWLSQGLNRNLEHLPWSFLFGNLLIKLTHRGFPCCWVIWILYSMIFFSRICLLITVTYSRMH